MTPATEHEYRVCKPNGACVWRGHAPTPDAALEKATASLRNWYGPEKTATWTVHRADLPRAS